MWKKCRDFCTAHPDLCVLLLLALGIGAVFGRSIFFARSDFDDFCYIGQRQMLCLSWRNWYYWLTHPVLRLYSPLAMHSYMLDQALWGAEHMEIGVRIQNFLWHFAAAAGFYALLRQLSFVRKCGERVFLSPLSAGFAAALFAWHPQRIESVVWLSERKDVMMAALGCWALFFFWRAHCRGRNSVAAPILLLLSFGAKPMLVPLPLLFALMLWSRERCFRWRLWAKRLAPSLAVTAGYFLCNAVQLRGAAVQSDLGFRLLRTICNFGRYFSRVWFPWDLQTVYPLFDPAADSLGRGILLLAVAAALFLTGLRFRAWRPAFWFGILPLLLAFMIALLPVSGIVTVGNVDCADRYSYFPSLFPLTLLAFWGQLLWNAFPRWRKLIAWCFVLWPLLLAGQTFFLLETWRTPRHYLMSALESPRPSRSILWQAAFVAVREKDPVLLESSLARSYALAGSPEERHLCGLFALQARGVLLCSTGNPGAGLRMLDRVFVDSRWHELVACHCALLMDALRGAAYLRQRMGDRANAAILYRMLGDVAQEINPIEAEFYRGLSALLRGDLAEAESRFLKAHALGPEDENIRKNCEAVRKLRLQKESGKGK